MLNEHNIRGFTQFPQDTGYGILIVTGLELNKYLFHFVTNSIP